MGEVLQLFGIMAGVIGVPMLVISVVPAIGKAISQRLTGRAADDDAVQAELQELRDRVLMLEEREARIAELEERLDFTERVIAQGGERQLHG